jgi:hypothetical protein
MFNYIVTRKLLELSTYRHNTPQKSLSNRYQKGFIWAGHTVDAPTIVSLSVRNLAELTYEELIQMTRKDYVMLAEVVKNLDEVIDEYALEVLANNMADALAADNDRFDRSRFLSACGVK